MLAFLAALLVIAAPTPAADAPALPHPAPVTTWRIDPVHSELLFRVRHLVSRVTGTFTDWEGTIVADPGDWKSGSASVIVRTASISTNNQRRDTHLRSPDFFHVQSFPEMTFKSTSVTLDGDAISVAGELSIRGTTRPVVLAGTFNGISPSPDGKDRVGFEVSTRINRLDYGLSWNRAVEGGGMLLGDEVTVQVTVEAVRQP
jgi:polyisoprenoid-binding protein YceI